MPKVSSDRHTLLSVPLIEPRYSENAKRAISNDYSQNSCSEFSTLSLLQSGYQWIVSYTLQVWRTKNLKLP